MKVKPQVPLTQSVVFVLSTIAATAGCTNFEHPLPWSHSPLHEQMPGSWHAVEDSEPPMPVEVVKNESGSLYVEMMNSTTDDSVDSDSSQPSDSSIQYVSFQGDVLALNNVHVLQIDMSTYKEHKSEEEESDSTDHKGYRFLLVDSEEESMTFQQLDIEQFARYAEAHFLNERTTFTASEFASCVDTKIGTEITSIWVAELLKERPTNWLTEDERSELEQVLKEFETREVNPYWELQQMRECIANKLPGDALGTLFSSDPEASFRGETIRLMKAE